LLLARRSSCERDAAEAQQNELRDLMMLDVLSAISSQVESQM
jgi:hypothetical protein